ncbi:MAG: PIN domain-containing protein [Verrucomicrobiae bacterium]|nr:PIN domain-containing protein [Verrucomicrobiae bacterium]
MRVPAFIDTNIFLHLVSSSPGEAPKQKIAANLLASTRFGISMQVIQEFYVNAVRKIEKPLANEDAMKVVEWMKDFPLIETDWPLFVEAARIQKRFQLSYWDSAILAAAERLGAETLFSEDLNHGQKYGRIKVVNPYL